MVSPGHPYQVFHGFSYKKSSYVCGRSFRGLQWNLDLTKCQGTGEICSLYQGFIISKTSIQ